jgi:hypothetical protein
VSEDDRESERLERDVLALLAEVHELRGRAAAHPSLRSSLLRAERALWIGAWALGAAPATDPE